MHFALALSLIMLAMTMTATNVGGGPAGEMTMKLKVDACRLGACDGREKVLLGN